jgi:hypothetical protein
LIDIKLLMDAEPIKSELKAKITKMQNVLLTFADDESPVVSDIAKRTIFGGVGSPTLHVRTGATQKEGLSLKKFRKLSSKSNSAGEAFWSHATNIFDNFKERKRLGLLKRLKKEFEADSKVQRIFQNALKDFDNVK